MSETKLCPVCGAGSLEAAQRHISDGDTARTYTLFHCGACGVEHWDPLEHPGAAFYEDEKVMIYQALHDGKGRPDDPRFELFFRSFPELRGIRALDIGCSDGTFLSQLAARGNTVWGIDIDAKALAVARQRGLTNVRRSEVAAFVSDARRERLTFDLVTAFDVIEHLTDPVAALRELASVIEPGGRLVGTVPNRRRRFANSMPIDFPPHHFFRFDTASMQQTLARAGFVPERVDAFQYNYSSATALAKVLRPFRPSRSRQSGQSAGESRASRSRSLRALARRVALRGFDLVTVPISLALERPGARGFKLFFAAQKAA